MVKALQIYRLNLTGLLDYSIIFQIAPAIPKKSLNWSNSQYTYAVVCQRGIFELRILEAVVTCSKCILSEQVQAFSQKERGK